MKQHRESASESHPGHREDKPSAASGSPDADGVATAVPESLLDSLVELALELAAAAAAVHRSGFTGEVRTKSSATDPVTQVDRDCERLIIEGITRTRPDDGVLGEEGAHRIGTTGFRWVVDPLDGTVNYLYGFPSHAVSIGVEFRGVPVVGVAHDTALDEVYRARLGGGAFRDDIPIRPTGISDPARALVATGFAYEPRVRRTQAAVLDGIIDRIRDIRRAGSAAVDMCWTASGRVDAYYETGPHPWDVTAGLVIVGEAGGTAAYDPVNHRVMASGRALWSPLAELLTEAGWSPPTPPIPR